MPTLTKPSSPSSVPLRSWLDAVSPLIVDRRATSGDLARDLIAHSPQVGAGRDPVREAGRIAEMARTDLGLAAAMLHHSQAAYMLDEAGAGYVVNGTLLWGFTGTGLQVDAGPAWTVSGCLETCCEPPAGHAVYVVVDHDRGHLLSVDLAAGRPGSVHPRCRVGSSPAAVSFDGATAVLRGRLGADSLAHAVTYGRLLETAAWYGALTRLGDALVATEAGRVAVNDRQAVTRLAEIDAVLSSTWGAIRDGLGVWERGLSSMRTARHHAAQARTLTRLAASSVVFGYVPNEDAAAGAVGLPPAVREDLVAWIARSDLDADAGLVAESLVLDGPSW